MRDIEPQLPKKTIMADPTEILRYLGVRGAAEPALLQRIQDAVQRCQALMQPDFVYRSFPCTETEAGIQLPGSVLVLPKGDITRHLHGAVRCCLMAVTLGAAVEMELVRLNRRNVAAAVIFDAVCTEMIEKAADACQAQLALAYRKDGLVPRMRFSPGYGDCPLALQGTLLRILDAEKRLGLTLTETDMLIPSKSITAIVGLYPVQ